MKRVLVLAMVGVMVAAVGCGKKQTAMVDFSYTIKPAQTLSDDLKVAVMDARVDSQVEGDKGEFDEKKWSELAAEMIRGRLQNSAQKNKLPITLVDREHLKKSLGEKDLAAANLTDSPDEMASAKVEGANAILTSKITVKIDKQKGTGRTVSGLGAVAGHWGGGGNVETEQVDKESRGITVTCQFELLDAAKHAIIVAYSGEPTQHFEKGKTSPFFGGSKTESDMTPRDKIIYAIVDDQLTRFLGKFVPTELKDSCEVPSGKNKLSQEAVRAMVVDDYDGALTKFKAALVEDGEDHKSLFGAGVCCEKLDKMPEALKYYKQARSLEPKNEQYTAAVQRVSMLMGV
jgi:hypothetical protein